MGAPTLSHWRKRLGSKAGVAVGRELAGGACQRGTGAARTSSRSRSTPRCSPRSISFPDRCPACCTPPSKEPQPLGQQARRAASAILRRGVARHAAAMMAGRYAPRQAIQPSPPAIADPCAAESSGRLIRDIGRKIAGHQDIEAGVCPPRWRAPVRSRGASNSVSVAGSSIRFHAPETEYCIGKEKASAPLRVRRQGLHRHHQRPRPAGGQFVLHAKGAAPGNPYDRHTLRDVIDPETQKLTGREIRARLCRQGVPRTRCAKYTPRSSSRDPEEARRVRRHRNASCDDDPAIEPVITATSKPKKCLGRCFISKAAPAAPPTLSLSAVRLQLPPHPRMAEGSFAPNPEGIIALLHESCRRSVQLAS